MFYSFTTSDTCMYLHTCISTPVIYANFRIKYLENMCAAAGIQIFTFIEFRFERYFHMLIITNLNCSCIDFTTLSHSDHSVLMSDLCKNYMCYLALPPNFVFRSSVISPHHNPFSSGYYLSYSVSIGARFLESSTSESITTSLFRHYNNTTGRQRENVTKSIVI
jgi:hypothetical protein